MRVTTIDIPGVLVLEPTVLRDHRGFFAETYHVQRYQDAGIVEALVQDNISRSVRGTLRGLHFQEPHAQGKLVMAVEGSIYDVVVDIRVGSPTFGRWYGLELSDQNLRQIYVPTGCAHGFCVTSETAIFLYKCTDYYSPKDEHGVLWNDPALAIPWPITDPILSAKDRQYLPLAQMKDALPLYKETESGGLERR